MKRLLLFSLVSLAFCLRMPAEVLTNGLSFAVASNAMVRAGYVKTYQQMMPAPGQEFECWVVDRGVLFLNYSNTSQKIVSLDFYLTDGGPKATRKTFDLDVTSFDTSTGLMTIRTVPADKTAATNAHDASKLETKRNEELAISKLVRIGTVSSQYAERVTQVLKQAGIQSQLIGAESCLILVPPAARSQAESLLRADSAAQKYDISFQLPD